MATPWPPRNFLQASCFNVLKLSHTCASQQLPAFMRFQYLGFSPSSLHNFLHASSLGFNIFALIWFLDIYTSPRPWPLHKLIAFILFQYLRFLPGAPQQLPAFILLQYLNCLPSAPQELPELIWFHIWFPRCLSAFSCMHLVSKSRFPPHRLSTTSCMLRHLGSMSRLHPSSLSNLLRSSGFNI